MSTRQNLLFVLILIFCSTFLYSQTTIPGGDVSGTWLQSGSPYLIEGEITIPDGETLAIDPGVLVEFQGHYKFNVQGRILAEGTEQDSIFFTIADTTGFSNFNSNEGSWDSFEFIETPVTNDSSKFKYCRIEYAKSISYYSQYGGAFEIRDFSKIKIANCTLENNAADYGGIIFGSNAHIIIINNFFTNNFNGIKLISSNALIANNTFHDNSIIGEEYGIKSAGVTCVMPSNPIIMNNTFTNNLSQSGGAISIFFDCAPIIVNNLIINNESYSGGAIKLSSDCQGIIVNNTICCNQAFWGGGIYCSNVTTDIVNNIIWGNSAESSGDQIYIYMYEQNACPDFSYCDIEGGFQAFGSGGTFSFNGIYENNIDEDPLFLNNPQMPYALSELSPCVVAGNPDTTGLYLPEYDLAGNPRIANGRIDIGGYEYQGELFFVLPPVFDPEPGSFQYPVSVSISTPTENAIIYYTLDGTDPDQNSILYTQPILIQETTTIKARAYKEGLNPSIIVTGIFYILGSIIYVDVNGNGDFETIQEAINAAVNGDLIIVANGIYTGVWNRNLTWEGNEKHLNIKSENGAESCIIDVEESGSAFNFYGTYQDSTDVIDGFTIKNADNSGIICNYSSPTIINNCLENNSSSAGGGIFLSNSNAIIKDNIIQNNSITPAFWPSSSDGGGICIFYGAPLISNNIIYNNSASTNVMETGATGGGIYIFRSNVIVENNLISNNTGYSVYIYSTGGIETITYTNDEYLPIIRNNTITNNLGNGLRIIRRAIIVNNICTMNSRNGLSIFSDFFGEIGFNDIWGNNQDFVNCPPGIGDTSWGFNYNGTACDSCFNISEDPLFVSNQDEDFFLSQLEAGQSEQSPCVDAGSDDVFVFELESYTTRTDYLADVGIVDIGYHYPDGIIITNVANFELHPKLYQLSNYPNPFNPSTTISFDISRKDAKHAKIEIYNIKGQKVKTLECDESLVTKTDGHGYSISWNGTDENNKPVSSGIYLYKLDVDGKTRASKKMLLLK